MAEPAATQKQQAAGPALDPSKLSPNILYQDMLAEYLVAKSMAGDGLSIAFAAVYVLEAAGFRIVKGDQ